MFDLLLYFVQEAGRVVGHREFLDRVWADSMVTDAVLVQNVAALRRILDQRKPKGQFIETIPKRGYRFVAEVSIAEGFPGAGPRISLAVLPLGPATQGPAGPDDFDLSFLRVAIADAISLRLGRHPDIAVRPLATLLGQGVARLDPVALGRRIDVIYLVTGRLARDGNHVAVSIELIHVASEQIAWSREFVLTDRTILAVEKKISRCLYQVVTQKSQGVTHDHDLAPTPNAMAYQSYLRGRYFWGRRSTADLSKAIQYFEESVKLDPGFGLAYSGICDCHTMLVNYGSVDPRVSIPRARSAAARAMEICPQASEVHASLGYVHAAFDWDWPASEKAFRMALELNPNNVHVRHWLAVLFLVMGAHERAIALAEQARDVDPLSPYLGASIALVRYLVGDFVRAGRELEAVLELEPSSALARLYLGRVHLAERHFRRALNEFTLAQEFFQNGFVEAEIAQAEILAGARADGERRLADLLARRRKQYVSPYALAQAFDALGESKKVKEMLGKALREHSISMMWFGVDPRFAAIRKTPFGQELLERTNHLPAAPTLRSADLTGTGR